MYVLHAGHSLSPAALLAVGAAAGLLATLVANVPMHRQSEGSTPAFVAAGALTRSELTEVSGGAASAVHYAAGVASGLLFALAAWALDRALPATARIPGTRLEWAPHVLAGLLLLGFLFVSFGYLVLPLFGREARSRAGTVRKQWFVTATVYVAALLVLVPVGAAVV